MMYEGSDICDSAFYIISSDTKLQRTGNCHEKSTQWTIVLLSQISHLPVLDKIYQDCDYYRKINLKKPALINGHTCTRQTTLHTAVLGRRRHMVKK
jgi:hypothetical protein